MRRRQQAGGRSSCALGAIDETECLHGLAHGVVRVPAPAAEEARFETLRSHPLRLVANPLRRIAAGRARVARARPVRVQTERPRARGPDQGSRDAYGACVLGHQRLQVLAPELGSQPVQNEGCDVVAVFNGELYNFAELRAELAARGHEVRGRGDTPVIPHLYEEHGPRFVERLEGMFALALWDAPRRRLVLARDRVGQKPLVWTKL